MICTRILLVSAWLLAAMYPSLMASAQSVAQPAAPSNDASAEASTDDGRARASGHFRRGVELFQEGAYRAALVEFERAYEIAPNYRLLYNIGQTRLLLHDYLAARQALKRYLEEGASQLSSERIAGVEEKLSTLSGRVARIAVEVNLSGAQIFIDDEEVGSSPLDRTVSVNVGRHRVLARGADGTSVSQTVDVAGGDVREVLLELRPASPAAVVAPVAVETVTESSSATRALAITATVLAGTAAIAAGAGGYLASQANNELQDSLGMLPGDPAEIEKQRDRLRLLAYGTDGAAGVAVLFTGVSGILWWLSSGGEEAQEDEPAVRMRVSLVPGGLGLRGKF